MAGSHAAVDIQQPGPSSPAHSGRPATSRTGVEHGRPATARVHFDQPGVVHATPSQPATAPVYLYQTQQPSIIIIPAYSGVEQPSMPPAHFHQMGSHQPYTGHVYQTGLYQPLNLSYSVAEPPEHFVGVSPWMPKRRFSQPPRDSEGHTLAAPQSSTIIHGPRISEDAAESGICSSPQRSPELSGTGLAGSPSPSVHPHRTSTRSDPRAGAPLSPHVGSSQGAGPRPASPASLVEYYGAELESGIYQPPPNSAQVPFSAFPETTEATGANNASETSEGPVGASRVNQWVYSTRMADVPPSASSISTPTYSSTLPPPATNPIPKKLPRRSDILSAIIPSTLVLFVAICLDGLLNAVEQLYLHCLLRIPLLYTARIFGIFNGARLDLQDISRLAQARGDEWDEKTTGTSPPTLFSKSELTPLPGSLLNFKASWNNFVDSLLHEWKTLNLISALLLSAILTLLQIEAASHPIIHTTALFSLICALMSLLYGCIYIIRFSIMRTMHMAGSFLLLLDARSGNVGCWWNLWVLLAMPAIWLSWSIITFLASIMSFIWLSGSSLDGKEFVLSPRVALGTRIGLTLVFALGLVYFVLIVREFHRYRHPWDEAWQRAVNDHAAEPNTMSAAAYPYATTPPLAPNSYASPMHPAAVSQTPQSLHPFYSNSRRAPAETLQPSVAFTMPRPSGSFIPQAEAAEPIMPVTLMRLGRKEEPMFRLDSQASRAFRVFLQHDLDRFMSDVSSAWLGEPVLMTKLADDTVLNVLYSRFQPAQPPPRPVAPIPPSSVVPNPQSWSHFSSAESGVRYSRTLNHC
ncbi:hypothetical protein HMN09_01353900 [Mycena chlorophos]|uniref:Uncharacterized protein n=1 Tax=Mycena chlorophos TaxID=658473 RepID=A0A8H6RY77_MYCCL|nr:hypothetical protein HMN09_01353900 [Mycena chlorophos]